MTLRMDMGFNQIVRLRSWTSPKMLKKKNQIQLLHKKLDFTKSVAHIRNDKEMSQMNSFMCHLLPVIHINYNLV